jgi:hypothetical protein
MYVGCMVIWMLSKCIHIAGVGLLSLPRAKVLAASRKLKSSWTKGRGMGQKGRIARRSKKAEAPTSVTANAFLRAMRANVLSSEANQGEPIRGKANATAIAIAVNAVSINISEGPVSGLEVTTIF